MNACQTGNIYLVEQCLNLQMNPFEQNVLGMTAVNYCLPFQNVEGYRMSDIVEEAQRQWRNAMESDFE